MNIAYWGEPTAGRFTRNRYGAWVEIEPAHDTATWRKAWDRYAAWRVWHPYAVRDRREGFVWQ